MLTRRLGRLAPVAGFGALLLLGPGDPAGAQHDASAVHVSIEDYTFQPVASRVSAGDTVVWTNADSAEHDVTAADGAFASPGLATGGSWSFTFDAPGVYEYLCSVHPEMTGTVEVVSPVEPSTTAAPTAMAGVALPAPPPSAVAAVASEPGRWVLELDRRLVLGAVAAGLAVALCLLALSPPGRGGHRR